MPFSFLFVVAIALSQAIPQDRIEWSSDFVRIGENGVRTFAGTVEDQSRLPLVGGQGSNRSATVRFFRETPSGLVSCLIQIMQLDHRADQVTYNRVAALRQGDTISDAMPEGIIVRRFSQSQRDGVTQHVAHVQMPQVSAVVRSWMTERRGITVYYSKTCFTTGSDSILDAIDSIILVNYSIE